jgi:hypothetical protein
MRIYGGPVPGTHFHEVDLFSLFNVPIRFDTETSGGLITIHFFNGSASRPSYSLKMESIEPGRVESAIRHIYKILYLSDINENLLERICQYIHHYIGIKLLGWPKYSNL